jgi:hypothetical protein
MSKTNKELEHGLVADLYEDEEYDGSGVCGPIFWGVILLVGMALSGCFDWVGKLLSKLT